MIFVFLRNVPATIIPSISVPVSLIGTLAVMYQLNYSIDNLSLMALIIATGFVVDDSIVMIENIVRYLEEGKTPLEAALEGAGQIGFTILSLTISLIAVLIPLLFMGGVIGRLFSEFAVTLAVTIVISAVVSLTVVPMLCARILRAQAQRHPSRFERISEGLFDKTLAAYERGLRWVLDHQMLTLAGGARHRRADGDPVRRDSEGPLSGAGRRRDRGHQRGRQLGVVHRDGEAPERARRRDPERPGCRLDHLVRGHRRHQLDAEQWPLPDQPARPRQPLATPRRKSPGAAAGSRRGAGHHALYCSPSRI